MEIIIRENEIATSFFIIEKGMVKLFKNLPVGKEFLTGLRGEGETFSPNSIIKGIPNFASAVALDDTSVLAIRKKDFLIFVDSNPIIKSRIADLDRETIDNFYE
jgi:CRP/FNR family transcriptional regulator